MSFTDTGFVVRLLSEEDQSYYTIRVLELQNTKVSVHERLLGNVTLSESGVWPDVFCEVKLLCVHCCFNIAKLLCDKGQFQAKSTQGYIFPRF